MKPVAALLVLGLVTAAPLVRASQEGPGWTTFLVSASGRFEVDAVFSHLGEAYVRIVAFPSDAPGFGGAANANSFSPKVGVSHDGAGLVAKVPIPGSGSVSGRYNFSPGTYKVAVIAAGDIREYAVLVRNATVVAERQGESVHFEHVGTGAAGGTAVGVKVTGAAEVSYADSYRLDMTVANRFLGVVGFPRAPQPADLPRASIVIETPDAVLRCPCSANSIGADAWGPGAYTVIVDGAEANVFSPDIFLAGADVAFPDEP